MWGGGEERLDDVRAEHEPKFRNMSGSLLSINPGMKRQVSAY